jgi:hypothetical protein
LLRVGYYRVLRLEDSCEEYDLFAEDGTAGDGISTTIYRYI